MKALALAAERGHDMEKVTERDNTPWEVWTCLRCALRVVRFGENEYGSALENDCELAA